MEWDRVAFPLLAVREKWKTPGRNPKIGDIVMLRYDKKWKDLYRLARVTDVKVEEDCCVRTVIVTTKDRRIGAQDSPGSMLQFEVAVQRMHVLLPKEEQEEKATSA